ncbi:MAG: hypothetical protein HGA49_09115 [Eubacteriaceae bacterium]|nr:hypothetical protein [Eubacteriaceae bacterium]
MLLTLILVFLLQILVISLMPLSVMQYKSTSNYQEYLELGRLAEGAREEALSLLYSDWNTQITSPWINAENVGEYKYTITALNLNEKSLNIQVRNSNLLRSYKATIRRNLYEPTLDKLAATPLYCNGDITLNDLSKITSCDPQGQIFVSGDLNIENIQNPGSLKLLIYGNIYINRGIGKEFITRYPVVKGIIPAYDLIQMVNYKLLLKSNFSDKIKVIENSDTLTIEQDTFADAGAFEILFIDSIDHVKVNNFAFKGLVVVNSAETLDITGFDLEGILIVSGNSGFDTVVDAENLAVKGTAAFMGCNAQNGLDLSVHWDPLYTDNLLPYLTLDFDNNNDTKFSLDVLEYKEVE